MPSDFEVPRFARELLNPHIVPAQDDDAFQQLVEELLRPEDPGLHAPETLFECALVSEDGLEPAEARWREVEDRLRHHLADPAGSGPSRYAPWYSTDPPFRTYVFCLSSLLQNEGQRETLRERIRTFFGDLAAKHTHLRHLAGVEVRIRDWEDWRTLLAARPHLLFRWFPAARHRDSLDTEAKRQAFRDAIKSWLSAHGDELEASFLFKLWLDAGGKPRSLQNALLRWLSIHGTHDDAGHVLAAWLKARRSFTLVEDVASRWLKSHREDFKAALLIKFLAQRTSLSTNILRDILAWCRRFHQDQEALSYFTSLDAHLLREEVAPEVAEITKLLVETALSQEPLPRPVSSLLSALFAILSESPWLREQTAPLFLRWLRHPSSFTPSRAEVAYSQSHLVAQRPSILFYLRDLIDSGELSVTRDREDILRFFGWIGTWGSNALEQVRPLLTERAGSVRRSAPE